MSLKEINNMPLCLNCGNNYVNYIVRGVNQVVCHTCGVLLECSTRTCRFCGIPKSIYRFASFDYGCNYLIVGNIHLCPNHKCPSYIVDKQKKTVSYNTDWNFTKLDNKWIAMLIGNIQPTEIQIESKYTFQLLDEILEDIW